MTMFHPGFLHSFTIIFVSTGILLRLCWVGWRLHRGNYVSICGDLAGLLGVALTLICILLQKTPYDLMGGIMGLAGVAVLLTKGNLVPPQQGHKTTR
jgi:hypothetical protein